MLLRLAETKYVSATVPNELTVAHFCASNSTRLAPRSPLQAKSFPRDRHPMKEHLGGDPRLMYSEILPPRATCSKLVVQNGGMPACAQEGDELLKRVHPQLAVEDLGMRMHPGHMAVPMPPMGPVDVMAPHPRSMPMGMPHFVGPPMVASQPPHAGGLVFFIGTGGHGNHLAMRMALNPVLGGPVFGTGGWS